jgi:neutral ceramidase
MTRRLFEVIIGILAIAALTGCALLTEGDSLLVPGFVLPAAAPFADGFRAGVGRSDITPPAGFPTGGHGPAGAMARGTWTPLHARAFFFADKDGHVAVFVSCDLFAIPGGLAAKVAHDVGLAWKERGISIPPEAITLAATHTHQSPGNFLTAAAYNEGGSKYAGFSQALFDFLARQIRSAIDMAVQDALDNGPADLQLLQGKADSVQLNRSPRTFLLNADALQVMDRLHPPTRSMPRCEPVNEMGEARSDFDLSGCPRRRAFDPSLTVLKISREGGIAGAMVFYAVHPTVLDHHAPLYSSDFTGVAMSLLEHEPQSAGKPVFGFFNGAEGDVVAERSVRDVHDVLTLGNAFAESVTRLLKSAPTDSIQNPLITIGHFDFRTSSKADRQCGDVSLAGKPLVGAPALGGAEDDRTLLYGLGFREGLLEIARDGQGGKLGGLDSQIIEGLRLSHIVAPPRKFPNALPLRYVRIGSFVLAAIPAEVSTMAGHRIVDRLKGEGSSRDDVVIVGLANEYTGYAATAEEYAAQDYMAASTIWGPGEAEWFACRLERLKAAAPTSRLVVEPKRYLPGHPPEAYDSRVHFGPRGIGELRSAADEELGDILRYHRPDPFDPRGVPVRGLPTVYWTETVADGKEFDAAAQRRVSIRRIDQPTGPGESPGSPALEDACGCNFVTLLREAPTPKEPGWKMAAIWLGPILDDSFLSGTYEFRIEFKDRDGQLRICTADPFKVGRDSATEPSPPHNARCSSAPADEGKH